MIVNIPSEPNDHSVFLTALCGLVARIAAEHHPREVYAIRINKWFDHKWLRYSGKTVIHFPEGYIWFPTALDECSQTHLTLPPFNPKQVTSETTWLLGPDSTYRAPEKPKTVHKKRLEHSSWNLQNRLAAFSDSAALVWFTSNTASNGRGAVMIYAVDHGKTAAWYASFRQEGGWTVDRVKGIPLSIAKEWFPLG